MLSANEQIINFFILLSADGSGRQGVEFPTCTKPWTLAAILKRQLLKGEFIRQFFGKAPDEVTLEDIENYFATRQEESSTLEFKSGEVEIHDVYKEVAAFLNTEGGLLIIGAPREKREVSGKRVINYCLGEITFSRFVSKDWLNQKLFSNITPSSVEILIKEIATEKGNLFIIDVPQSLNPPHQADADGRYYIRIDNEAKPAPHGLIQALFDKRRKPKLSAVVERQKRDHKTDQINVSVRNETNIPADKVGFIVDVYNVQTVEGKCQFTEIEEEGFGVKYSCSESASQVLVSVVRVGIRFDIIHSRKRYLVAVSYWCKETDFDCTYFVINPTDNSITENGWLDEGVRLTEVLETLNE